MASDDEDEELKALRLAVLLSMKKKVDKEQSPPKPKKTKTSDLEALRHAALANIESAGVKPNVPQPIPTANSSLYKAQSYPKVVHNNFNSASPGAPRSRPRASNLIVINPEPLNVPQKPVISDKKSVDKPVLLRPQDRWCSPNTGTTVSQFVEESKPKVPNKFSRYDSSDSDSSDVSSSDSETEEEKRPPSPKLHSDSEDEKPVSPKSKSDSESEKKALSSDISSDSDSDDIEKQIDNILNSPEIKDKKTDISDKTHEKVLTTKTPEKLVPKISDKPISTVSKTEVPKTEVKSIPTLIGGSKTGTGTRKKVNNAWSDSDSDSGIRSAQERQKLKKGKSWSDQGSSDEENKPVKNANVAKIQVPPVVEPTPQKTKAEIEKEKEDRKRMIENDLQKTLKALQSIKEKRRKQEASQKGNKSPESKHRKSSISPRRRSVSPRRRSPFERRRSSSRSPRRRRSFSPRRRRSRSYSRSPSGKRRSPSPSLRKRRSPGSRRSPDPRIRKRSPLAFKGAYHRRSPQSKRSPKNTQSGNVSPVPSKEKRVLTSEERKKIEARRKKFESSAVEVKKTISLKNIVRKSNSRERSPSPKINSPKDRAKKLTDSSQESSTKKRVAVVENKASNSETRRISKESKQNNDNEDSDASKGSVSSLSDSDSEKEESRAWRKEQNNTKHLNKRKLTDVSDRLDRPGFDRHKRDHRPRFERSKRDQQGFERSQRDPQGFERSKRDEQGFERSKRDPQRFDRSSQRDQQGLVRSSQRDPQGLDRSSQRDPQGLDRSSQRDQQGLDRSKRDQQGFERSKRDQQGFERSRDGLDTARTSRPNKSGLDPQKSLKDKEPIKDDLVNETKSVANDIESKELPKKVYRSDSHVFSDNIDRGFDASNYRKTKIDSGVASGGSDSDGSTKDKKLVSVVLPSDSKHNSPAPIITSPIRKVECSETVPEKSHRKHHKNRSERHKNKRVVITDIDEMPRKKKMKTGDARNLLEAIKNQGDNSRRAVIRKDGISVTLEDPEPDSPRKPSVHERLGRKVPSLMSIQTEDLRRGRSPEPEPKVLKLTTKELKRSKEKSSRKLDRGDSFEKKSKKKRSIIHYESPDEEDTNDDNALEKRIQMIKEKNAAILKRQAEIQKDKEIFG